MRSGFGSRGFGNERVHPPGGAWSRGSRMGVRGKKGGGSPAAFVGEPQIVPLTPVLGLRARGQGGRFEIRPTVGKPIPDRRHY